MKLYEMNTTLILRCLECVSLIERAVTLYTPATTQISDPFTTQFRTDMYVAVYGLRDAYVCSQRIAG